MTTHPAICNIVRVDFENIYNCTFQYVYRFFYYKSVNPSSIEDLSHEVYLRFYKKYGQERFEETEAKRILFGFCRNIYREWVREQVKEKRADFLENYDYEGDENDEQLGTFEVFSEEPTEFEKRHDEQKKILIEALQQLNPRVREVLECRFFHNMSRKDIAEKLGISEKDVHTYQKRGVKYLKKIINGEVEE